MKRRSLSLLTALILNAFMSVSIGAVTLPEQPSKTSCQNDSSHCKYFDSQTVAGATDNFELITGKAFTSSEGGALGGFYWQTSDTLSKKVVLYEHNGTRSGNLQAIYGVALNEDGANKPTVTLQTPSLDDNQLWIVGQVGVEGAQPATLVMNGYITSSAFWCATGSKSVAETLDRNILVVKDIKVSHKNGWGGERTSWAAATIALSGASTSISDNIFLFSQVDFSDQKRSISNFTTVLEKGHNNAQVNNNQMIVEKGSNLEVRTLTGVYFSTPSTSAPLESTARANAVSILDSTISNRIISTNATSLIATTDGAINAQSNTLKVQSSTLKYNSTPYVGNSYVVTSLAFVGASVASINGASDNHVTMDDVTMDGLKFVIVGGSTLENSSFSTAQGSVSGNSVTIGAQTTNQNLFVWTENKGDIDHTFHIYGGAVNGQGSSTQNAVTLSKIQSSVALQIAGARNTTKSPDSLNVDTEGAWVSHNSVAISDSTLSEKVQVVGGIGRTSQSTTVSNFGTDLFVASSSAPTVSDGTTLTVSNNQVSIQNTQLTSAESIIVGGAIVATGGQQQAIHNTVTIGENVTGADGGRLTLAGLYGGYITGTTGQAYLGNTLNVSSPLTTGVLKGFQTINFIINESTLTALQKDPSKALIEVTDSTKEVPLVTDVTQTTAHSTITLSASTDSLPESLVLIRSAAGFITYDFDHKQTVAVKEGTYDGILTQGITFRKARSLTRVATRAVDVSQLSLVVENGTQGEQLLKLGIKETPPDQGGGGDGGNGNGGNTGWTDQINDETQALMGSSLMSYGALFEASDLWADRQLRTQGQVRDGLYVAARASSYEYLAHRALEANMVNGLIGYGATRGDTQAGAFIEMGQSHYETRYTLSSDQLSKGSGNLGFVGLGVYFDQLLPCANLQFTGYVKAGAMQNKFKVNLAGTDVNFDRTTPYYGLHLGLHGNYALSDGAATLRPYVSYFYDRRDREKYAFSGHDSVAGSDITYRALNAHRLQAGFLVSYDALTGSHPYFGLSLEDVLSATASGYADDTYGSQALKDADLEGVTGLLTVGYQAQSDDGKRLCNVAVTGYSGARNGANAMVQGVWRF